jgi:hypothetical protein
MRTRSLSNTRSIFNNIFLVASPEFRSGHRIGARGVFETGAAAVQHAGERALGREAL